MSNTAHDGHRNRLREKFLSDPNVLEDHELIELLLFYVIPRSNTNERAHDLLDRFGSIKGILAAGIPALCGIKDIGKSSATFIRVISEVLSRYEKSSTQTETPLSSVATLGAYLRSLFVGTTNEITYLLLFDASKRMILCKKISEGHATASSIDMRDILELAILNNASGAILAHNHPGGKAIPSGDDIATTNKANTLLEAINVQLIEHFIVAGDECRPILKPNSAKFENM
jgi:DNA repair protein RadC